MHSKFSIQMLGCRRVPLVSQSHFGAITWTGGQVAVGFDDGLFEFPYE